MGGLNCATDLVARGKRVLCLEASDQVGGRVRTDEVEGFKLDRGFQILISSYSEVQRKLDLDALGLREFKPGAILRINGRWHQVSDPVRDPLHAIASAMAPVGTIPDKLKVAALRAEIQTKTDAELLYSTSFSADEWLTIFGFSDVIKTRFFKPFFSGVFLEKELITNAGFFKFMYKMFAVGSACLPENGMGEIPKQLAAKLPKDSLRLNSKVEQIFEGGVRLSSGEEFRAPNIILATEAQTATRLFPALGAAPLSNACTTFYFAATDPPVKGAWLLLNAETCGAINSVAVLSEVAPSYAPNGNSLIAVTAIGVHDTLTAQENIKRELLDYFGEKVQTWRHLKTYALPNALPSVGPKQWKPAASLPSWLSVIGDFTEHPSLQGAMLSGAEAARNFLSKPVDKLR